MNTDKAFMQEAFALAQYAEEQGEVPVGAVVVFQDKIIGRGWNQSISHHDPTAHAEIIALREAAAHLGNYRLIDCHLYVTLEPCAMCAGAMIHARIKRLSYGASDPRTGAAGSVFNITQSTALNHCVEVEAGLMLEESRSLLQAFFAKRRKA